MGICYIFGAVPTKCVIDRKKDDLVIAADGGYRQPGCVKPDLVVGDFDSLGYVPEQENIIRHPVHKDDTDTMLAVKLGLEKGYDKFMILGGLGGRFDHTVANIQTLAYIRTHHAKGCLAGDGECAALLCNDSISFSGGGSGTVSAFAYGEEARGVTLEGLEYPLENATLTCDFPLGVSNAFTGAPAKISVIDGRLLVIWTGGLEKADFL
jgi:thiamine pyrophosphokinase